MNAKPVAQCACGRAYTASEFEQLPNRKPWPDFKLEIADCTACEGKDGSRTTIGREMPHA